MQQEQQETFTHPLQYMNQLSGSIESMWFALDMKGIYLPTIKSRAINAQYLWSVLNKRIFFLKKNEIKQGTLLKEATKLFLFDELSAIIGKEDLGFDEKSLPEKMWMINVIHSLEPQNALFKKSLNNATMQVTQDQIQLLKELDTSLGRKKNLCFFRRTKEQVQANKNDILSQKIKKQKSRVARKTKEKLQAQESLHKAEIKQANLKRTLEHQRPQ